MTFFERCRNFTVKVNAGSGVIFQPMTEEYTYILTARHNLYNDPETMQNALDDTNINAIGLDINFIKKYEHSSLDIAILKIVKINVETPLKEFEEPSKDLDYEFYGYPKYKIEENDDIEDQIENYEVKLSKQVNNILTFDNPKFANIDEIIGASGGGVFREIDDNIYLVAIEYEMNAKKGSIATHQRIDMLSIESFDEIIEKYSNDLEPLYPPFMNDFSILLDNIFILNGMEESEKTLIQNRLKFIAKNLSNKLKPIDIRNEFGLLESDYNSRHYINKELWSMYLEFIVISVFIDMHSPINTLAIEEINRKRKFLFLKSKDWKNKKKEILTSNFTSLDKNATVIVCCDGDRTPTSCIMNSRSLLKVGDGIMQEKFNIAKGINNPHTSFKFKHIHTIQKQMLDDYDDENNDVFDNANANNIEEIIRDEINKALN